MDKTTIKRIFELLDEKIEFYKELSEDFKDRDDFDSDMKYVIFKQRKIALEEFFNDSRIKVSK